MEEKDYDEYNPHYLSVSIDAFLQAVDEEEITFVKKYGADSLVRDMWNVYYRVKDTHPDTIIGLIGHEEYFIELNKNTQAHMYYIDTLNKLVAQIGEHIIPVDKTIADNIEMMQELVFRSKEMYDSFCDKSAESAGSRHPV